VSVVWLALLLALGVVTVVLWRGLRGHAQPPGQIREALVGSALVGILGGAFVGFLIYRLLTMDSGDASPDSLVRVAVISVAAAAYIAVVSADLYALMARMAGSSRPIVLVSLVLGPVVAVAAYLAVFTAAGPPTGS
jgi:hypothetical protein